MSAEPVVLNSVVPRGRPTLLHPPLAEHDAAPARHAPVVVSPRMQRLHDLMRKIAQTSVPVLILGESGTGKEVAARAIHAYSPRRNRPFLKVNCAALPRELLESELFGYEAGAFTGAARAKPGQFELCSSGTLLLDEIAEMPTELQAKLLHVIQDGKFCRLGGRVMVQVDVRVLAATNVPIQDAMEAKLFREDLYHRLATFAIRMPPLRERLDEIPALLEHFIHRFAAECGCDLRPVTPELLQGCLDYAWPGNLRELENVVKRYLILGNPAQVFHELAGGHNASVMIQPTLSQTSVRGLRVAAQQAKASVERFLIAEALEATNYNRLGAARLLKISYKSLRNKIRDYRLMHPTPTAPTPP